VVKPGFALSVSVFAVEVKGMFYYFDDFPDHVGTMDSDGGYSFCSVEVNGKLCFCGAFGHISLLIL
jgi:hypothetical protein